MTLTERRPSGGEVVHSDNEWLTRYRLQRMLGVTNPAIEAAAFRSEVEVRDGAPRHKYQSRRRLIRVGDIPKIIDALGKSHRAYENHAPYYPWASEVQVAKDFEVVTPAGITLTYKYDKP